MVNKTQQKLLHKMLVKLDFIIESWMTKDQEETIKIRVEIFFLKKQKEEEKIWF